MKVFMIYARTNECNAPLYNNSGDWITLCAKCDKPVNDHPKEAYRDSTGIMRVRTWHSVDMDEFTELMEIMRP